MIKKFSGPIIIKMYRQTIKFEEMVDRVQHLNDFSIILTKQLQKYDLQPYKIEECEPQTVLKMYQNIQNKYKITGELSVDQNCWNQNERRLFVWFIISYTYFLDLNNLQITDTLWNQLAPIFFCKKPEFLEFQYLNLLTAKKRVAWTEEEDNLLVDIIRQQKPGKWNQISKKMFYISNRTVFRSPKHCRERWLNHLDNNKRHGNWTVDEDFVIFKYVCENGKRWSKIVPLLHETRTEHMIKNRYNSLVSKNKSNKKQKEEEIANRIYKQLAKNVEGEMNLCKSPVLKNQMTATEGKSQEMRSVEESPEAVAENQENIAFPTLTYPGNFNYGCYIDYNTLFFLNRFYCAAQNSPFPSIQPEDKLSYSKNSSFTLYHAAN